MSLSNFNLYNGQVSNIIDPNVTCNECKRRKIKCSRDIPECDSCVKYHRHCLYEKHSKTPLTRKNLTKVEAQLELTTALLSKYIPYVDIQSLISNVKYGSIPLGSEVTSVVDGDDAVKPKKRKIEEDLVADTDESQEILKKKTSMMSIDSLVAKIPPVHHTDYDPTEEDLQVPQLVPSILNTKLLSNRRRDVSKQSKISEISPRSSNSGYVWDERSSNQRDLNIDGMATSQANGYLGASSCAALINLVGFGMMKKSIHRSLHTAVSLDSEKLNTTGTSFTKEKLGQYINQYFETYHYSYPIIHKALFMAQFNQLVAPPSTGWKSLLYMVATIGSFMSAENADEDDDLKLFACAKAELTMEIFEYGTLTLVQTLCLMSNYLQKRDRPNSGYNYLGIAVRLALGLGLHKEIESDESLLNLEIRRRVWWCLYIFDCGQTITYGRPLGIPCSGIDAYIPLNISDFDLTGMTKDYPSESDVPTIYSSLRLQTQFHLLTNSIYERIISKPFPAAKDLLEWDVLYVTRWYNSVPKYFAHDSEVASEFLLAKSVLEWRYRNLKIIMYRTHLLKNVSKSDYDLGNIVSAEPGKSQDFYEKQAGELCLKECKATIESISKFWYTKTYHNRMEGWYSLFFLIPAVVTPLVCIRNDPTSSYAENWRNDIITAKTIVEDLIHICPLAEKILAIIEGLGSGYVTTRERDNNVSYATSPTSDDLSPLSQFLEINSMLWPISWDNLDIHQFNN